MDLKRRSYKNAAIAQDAATLHRKKACLSSKHAPLSSVFSENPSTLPTFDRFWTLDSQTFDIGLSEKFAF